MSKLKKYGTYFKNSFTVRMLQRYQSRSDIGHTRRYNNIDVWLTILSKWWGTDGLWQKKREAPRDLSNGIPRTTWATEGTGGVFSQ